MKNKKMMVLKKISTIVLVVAYKATFIHSIFFAYQPALTDEMKNKIQSTR